MPETSTGQRPTMLLVTAAVSLLFVGYNTLLLFTEKPIPTHPSEDTNP